MQPTSFHPLFADHAVLQRDRSAPVWGCAPPGVAVTVRLARREAVARAGGDGRWCARLPPLPAGGPFTLEAVASDGSSAVSSDVCVGDVFLCSGQSNMEWPLQSAAQADLAEDDVGLRILTVPRRPSIGERTDLGASWLRCTVASARVFSAVGYFGARMLRRAYPQVPIGMICAAWGGTRIEPWMGPTAVQAVPDLRQAWETATESDRLSQADPAAHERLLRSIREPFALTFERWHDTLCAADGGEAAGFLHPDLAIGGWGEYPMPSYWPNPLVGNHDGVVWFACDVDVPADWAGREAILRLGEVDNEDTTWWNGVEVGATGMLDGPEHWCMQRNYPLQSWLLRPGRNRLVVRVIDYGGRGGFGGGPAGLCLESGERRLPLPATWHFRKGSKLVQPRLAYPAGWVGPADQNTPGALYGGMIAPLVPAALAGIWWYQGESNEGDPLRYRELLPLLVRDWRGRFGPPNAPDSLPFYWVQLTAWRQPTNDPGVPSTWALMREAQTLALKTPNTAQAVILDCGDAEDIHPPNKRDPGERLAALVMCSRGRPVPVAGPRFRGSDVTDDRIRLHFACSGALRTKDGREPGHVAICGTDRTWRWARTRIEGATVLAWHPEVATPVAARYAWADNPAAANLTDCTGLPAWPFRTDDWPTMP
jgi:sialate O-acetylesterase